MTRKETWYKGWWLIPVLLLIVFVAWKVYPIVKASETVRNVIRGKG